MKKKEEEQEQEEPFLDIGRIVEDLDTTTTRGSALDEEEATTIYNDNEKLSRIINNPELSQVIPGKLKGHFADKIPVFRMLSVFLLKYSEVINLVTAPVT